MALETTKWDVVDYLKTDEDVSDFLEAVFEDGDPALIVAAFGDVARAKGITNFVATPELTLDSVLKVMKVLGLRLTAVPLDDKAI